MTTRTPSPQAGPARTRRTQRERREESDRLLLMAAAGLIARQGYGATTLEQIGRAAGYSRGLVTQKFGSKEGLVRALIAILHQDLYMVLEEAIGDARGIAAVLRVNDVYLRIFTEAALAEAPDREISVKAYYVLMSESIGVIPEIREFFTEANLRFRAFLEAHLREAQAGGDMRDTLAPDIAAGLIQSALSGFTLLWLVDRNAIDMEATRDVLVETIRRTLVP